MPAQRSQATNDSLRRQRILFASAHSIVDFSNGASVATLDVLQQLAAVGFECQAFCTSRLDLQQDVSLERIIGDLGEPLQARPSVCGSEHAQILYTRRRRMPITVIRLESTRHTQQRPAEVRSVLEFFRTFLDAFAPDVMITYGGDPTTQGMIRLAKERGIAVVFMIHNFGYSTTQAFRNVDYCLVASEFARQYYREAVGLDCQVIPYAVDWERARVETRDPRFVTFVNPCLEKGVYPFARIADELGRRRPDIPLLVVESRGTRAHAGGLRARSGRLWQYSVHGPYHRLPAVLGSDQDGLVAVTMVGEPAPGRDRGHDQRHPRDRLQSRRHPREPERMRIRAATARATHAERPGSCPAPRRLGPGSRPSSGCGTIRTCIAARAIRPEAKPSAGIRTVCGLCTCSSSTGARPAWPAAVAAKAGPASTRPRPKPILPRDHLARRPPHFSRQRGYLPFRRGCGHGVASR